MTRRLERLINGDDRGYGVVLGAMVLLGMGMVAFASYQTGLAPQLEAKAEADQMATVADRLTQWAAASGQASGEGAVGGATTTLPLGHDAAPFATSPGSSTLSFDPVDEGVALHAAHVSITRLNGTLVGGTDEAWRSTDNATLGEIAAVDRFRLKVDEIDSSHTGESVTVHVTAADGAHAGDLRLSVVDPGGSSNGGGQGFELVVRTRDADGDVLYDQPILISSTTHDSHSDPISPYWVNLLNEDYRFDRVLGAAQAPFEVELEQDGLASSYAIAYARVGAEQDGGSSGLEVHGYNASFASGRVRFDGRTQQAEDQTLTLEHGALVRRQAGGDVFAKRPAFSATVVDHDVHVGFTWASLTGRANAVSSGQTVMLDGSTTGVYALKGQASNLTLNVTTDQPRTWARLFADELEDAGLTDGRGFETATGTTWARVDLWGLTDPDPASDAYDVSLDLRSPETAVRIG